MICDGVPDRDGEYLYPEDMDIEAFNNSGMIFKDHQISEDFVSTCKVEFQGTNLVVTDYQGPPIEGYLSVRGMSRKDGPFDGRFREFELISLGIHERPNSDPRIPWVKLR